MLEFAGLCLWFGRAVQASACHCSSWQYVAENIPGRARNSSAL